MILVGHNLGKHDLRVLDENKLISDINKVNFFDTLVAFHFLHENHYSKNLTATSTYYGGKPKNRSKALQSIIDVMGWEYVPTELTAEYCINDAEITAEAYYQIILEFGSEFNEALWDREQRFIRAVDRIERNRVRIDPGLCRKQSARGSIEMDILRQQLGLNPNSSKDLKELLIDRLGLPILKKSKETGNPSFDKEAMKQYEEEYLPFVENGKDLARNVLRYRGWSRATSSYYDAWLNLKDDNDEISCNFKIHGTVTGRLSCEKPNLQQIPREGIEDWNKYTKKCFLARPNMILVEWDYSQLEFRLAAAVAKETTLIEIFNSGADIFSEMAEELGWERDHVKTLVYATLYGGGNNRISNAFGVSIGEAGRLRNQFFNLYPRLREISRYAGDVAAKLGYIQYWSGRRRHLEKGRRTHKAFNAFIQGGAFEIVKDSIIRLDDYAAEHPDLKIVLQVHDSVWVEHPKNMDFDNDIKSILESVPQDFGVPFVVEKKVLNVSS